MNVIKEEKDTDEVGSLSEDAVGVPPTLTIKKSETVVSYVCVFPLCVHVYIWVLLYCIVLYCIVLYVI
jgi:hypothetical protein